MSRTRLASTTATMRRCKNRMKTSRCALLNVHSTNSKYKLKYVEEAEPWGATAASPASRSRVAVHQTIHCPRGPSQLNRAAGPDSHTDTARRPCAAELGAMKSTAHPLPHLQHLLAAAILELDADRRREAHLALSPTGQIRRLGFILIGVELVHYCVDCLILCYWFQVTNTPWGEKVMFTFQPGSDLVAKPLHVSPFMDMLGNWSIRADAPGDNLYVAISVQHPTLGNYFTAALHAKLVGQTSDSVKLATFFWLMPHKVAAGIYWEAFRLWLKNVRFLDHPRYLSLSYRDEALKRDLEIRSSCSFLRQKPQADIGSSGTRTIDGTTEISNHQDNKDGGGSIRERWCVWRDAQWPWC